MPSPVWGLLIGIAGPALGCTAHEQAARSPTPQQIASIDARAEGRLRVEPVGGREFETEHQQIESADSLTLTLRNFDGSLHAMPLEPVRAVSFVDRGRGAVAGAMAVGLVSGVMSWGFAALLSENSCSWDCAAIAGAGLVAGALLGGLTGYLLGGRRVIWLGPAGEPAVVRWSR
jgi:hypothetical protein